MCDEEWVKVAMVDDSLVVQQLLRLNQAQPPPLPPMKKSAPAFQLGWTVRQRRSKSAPRYVDSGKKGESTRVSPTTPLSWSGATSVSGGGGGGGGGAVDGFEESSWLAKPMESSRSKVAVPSESTINKRSRRKKTLAELKEEESFLLKERRNLKNELAALRLIVEKQRVTNESLKRMKIDFDSQQAFKTARASVVSDKAITDQMEACCSPIHPVLPTSSTCNLIIDKVSNLCSENGSSRVQEMSKRETSSMLPDLNLPVEDELDSAVLCGIR
ncbi:Major facilitator superfamily domain-containing protein [Quillaja saponaria]|uniref:Major facilitator superfamily domain-containing protein n=1 Tax=Quillaja saponaria TaxID=32244 RepID=A0AAD7PEL6_QUISA|nr:Major facilitator superfamily domain-containing protein [Quillaja saponaria]